MTDNNFTVGRVVEAIDRLTDTLERIANTQEEHGKRIGLLERWAYGAAAAVAAFLVWIGADAFGN